MAKHRRNPIMAASFVTDPWFVLLVLGGVAAWLWFSKSDEGPEALTPSGHEPPMEYAPTGGKDAKGNDIYVDSHGVQFIFDADGAPDVPAVAGFISGRI